MNVTKLLLILACVFCPAMVWAHSVSQPATDRLGPPAICFPLEIGDAKSLPWGGGPFARPSDYAVKNLAADVHRILDGSAETIVHMETLRRAAIWIGLGAPDEGKSKSGIEKTIAWQRERLLASLRARARALNEFLSMPGDQAPQGRSLGLALFDLGFFLGALGQIDGGSLADGEVELARAIRLCSKDGNVWLGYCLAGFERNGHQFPAQALQQVCQFAEKDLVLQANLVATVGAVRGHSSYDEIVVWANKRSVKSQ